MDPLMVDFNQLALTDRFAYLDKKADFICALTGFSDTEALSSFNIAIDGTTVLVPKPQKIHSAFDIILALTGTNQNESFPQIKGSFDAILKICKDVIYQDADAINFLAFITHCVNNVEH